MNKRFESVILAGLLIAATADAQRAEYTDYSASVALASPTMPPEARQAMIERIEAVNTKFRKAHGGQSPEQFGLQCCQITQIPAAAFTPANTPGPWEVNSMGYGGTTAGSALVLAPVSLPSGVEIEYLNLYYYDGEPTLGVTANLVALQGGGFNSGPPSSQDIPSASASSGGSSGYGYAFSTNFGYTVNNNVGFDPAAAQLMVKVGLTASLGFARFKAVDLWWMRQISPAPAAPTFTDVPTNHPFFQFVEALAAAGITVGYPDGRFGVDDPITRGEMAVFLAKALGLYWKY